MTKAKLRNLDPVFMGILGLCAVALRAPWIGLKYLDIDEAFQLFTVSRATLGQVLKTMYHSGPQQYPLDYLLGYGLTDFTQSLEIVRGLPLVWGVASVVTSYELGRRVGGRVFGWFWALLLSISALHIQYSITYRPYALIVFLSLFSLLSFVRSLEKRSWLWIHGFVVCLYQLVYPFAFCKSVLDIVVIYGRARSGKNQSTWHAQLGIFAAGLIIFMALFAFNVRGLVGGRAFDWPANEVLGKDVWLRIVLEYGQYSIRSAVCYVALFVVGVVWGFTKVSQRSVVIYGISLMGSTLLALVVSMLCSHVFLRSRHTLPLLPLFLAGAALACENVFSSLVSRRLPYNWPLQKIFVGALSVLFVIPALFTVHRYREELRGARFRLMSDVNGLSDHLRAGDKIVFNNPNSGATFLYYFDLPSFFRLESIDLFKGVDFFRFPTRLTLSRERFESDVFAQCRPSVDLATITPSGFRDLRRVMSDSGHKIWLVDFPFNYFSVDDPFRDLLEPHERPPAVSPGVYEVGPA